MATKGSNKPKIINYSKGKNLNVRLRGKRLKGDTISMFLDFYEGYSLDEFGKMKTKRKVEYLKLYISPNPKTQEERQKNDESLSLAQIVHNNRESDIQHKREGLVSPLRKKTNFLDFCDSFENGYQKKDIRMVHLAIKEFKSFAKDKYMTPQQIDPIKVRAFRDYLLKKYKGEGPNSTLARFKKILNAATEEGLFNRNPGEKVTCKIPTGIPKAILSPAEIISLSKTKCRNPEVKRAFLLCLNTGLRFVDVVDLKFKHTADGQIKKPQLKTGREVVIDLNSTAIKLIGEKKNLKDSVFNLPTFEGCLKIIRKWAEDAKIVKHLTWHSARHSFGTILMMNKTDIKTIMNLMGHSKMENTQKYTHTVDALKAQAVNTLPELDL